MLAVVDIQYFDAPVLRKKAKKVARVNKTVRKVLNDMLETMRLANGVGLAGPQVGVSKRLVVIDIGEGPRFLVNPEIVDRSDETEVQWEGCLSWPGYVGDVERSTRVAVKALDEEGRDIWIEGDGLLARCLQHEIDHLDGVLFVDRARTITEVPPEVEEDSEEASEEPQAPDAAAGDDVPGQESLEPERPLTTVFMGSPDFAVPSLEALVKAGVKVRLVITQPDRPFGRKRAPRPTPVKTAAEKLGLPVLSCENLKDEHIIEQIQALSPDFITVVAFGQKVPQVVIDTPRFACLNLHPSLLPKYRGGNPISRAILNGEKVTGVTIIYLTEKLDAGDICVQRQVEIGQDETFGELEAKLAVVGAGCLLEAMVAVYSGKAERKPQNHSIASRARHLRPGEDIVNWAAPAQSVHNLVRGLSPQIGAVTTFAGKRIKILSTRLTGKVASGAPGTIQGMEGDSVLVNCGDESIRVAQVQPGGKKRMTAKAFLIGRPAASGAFGDFVDSQKEGGT